MSTMTATFADVTAFELDTMPESARDALPFGVIGMDAEGIAQIYNETESRLAGLKASTVLGKPFFAMIGQCMNNYLVAQRFEDEPELDATIPYVLTLRMRPTPVELRLLAQPGAAHRYLLIAR